MIVFIAPFPALADEKDGMIQRVASIDMLVADLPRTYLDISFRRFWLKQTHSFGDATVYRVNGLAHIFFIVAQVRKARMVYIHSVFYSLKALAAYLVATPVTDLHGAVPEEFAYQGRPRLSKVFGLVERLALRRSSAVIHVTSAMKKHFHKKYARDSENDRIIAILPKISDVRGERQNIMSLRRDPTEVIYAGGLQAWQNIELMLAAAAVARRLRYVFLSGEAEVLQTMAKEAGVVDYTCAAVAPNEVAGHYLTATFGFILRDPVLLNQVACPTKLVEYMHWGVIPIVLSEDIGDFDELGYQFVSLADFRAGRIPDEAAAARMREINRDVVDRLIASCNGELSALRSLLRN
jgi:hypothetical protein